MKKRILYILLLVVFIIFVFFFVYSYLINNYSEKGKVNTIKKYSEIKFVNTQIDFETNISVNLIEKDYTIQIKIPEVNEITTNRTININMANIGNEEITLNECKIDNVVTNLEKSNPKITLINNNSIIKGGENFRIGIDMLYESKKELNKFYNFDIKCTFTN